jgi:hypothetical protein
VAEQRRLNGESRAGAHVLANTNHELFAQSIASGASRTEAYTAAYQSASLSNAGAAASASRLSADGTVSARIENLRASSTEAVVTVEIAHRSKRVQVLEDIFNRTSRIIQARAMESSSEPGAATGLLAKSLGGKDGDEEKWTLDVGLMSQRNAIMKQVAIEEGQWGVKAQAAGTLSNAEIKARLNAPRDRLAAAKKAALDRGEPWPPPTETSRTTAILTHLPNKDFASSEESAGH